MERHFVDLTVKLDRIVDDIGEIKVASARQEENLREHMRRTALAEEGITLARRAAEAGLAEVRIELRPIQRHVTMLEGALKLIGVVAVLVSLTIGVLRLLKGS